MPCWVQEPKPARHPHVYLPGERGPFILAADKNQVTLDGTSLIDWEAWRKHQNEQEKAARKLRQERKRFMANVKKLSKQKPSAPPPPGW